jgi:hypothetical protein
MRRAAALGLTVWHHGAHSPVQRLIRTMAIDAVACETWLSAATIS